MERCLIHDRKADEIIQIIKGFMKSFKFLPFDEDTGRGFLRHVLIKRGFATNQVMVVLVTSSKMFPGKNNFIKRSEEHTSELQSRFDLVCRLLLEKKKKKDR